MKFYVELKADGWHAFLDGYPEQIEIGGTMEEALGKLVVTHGANIIGRPKVITPIPAAPVMDDVKEIDLT